MKSVCSIDGTKATRSSLWFRMRHIACLSMALLITILLLPRVALADTTWERLWGQNAYDTMSRVVSAADAFPDDSGGSVVVATGDGYWDALAASGLAGRLEAPVLITPKDSLAAQARKEIERICPERIYVMGGTAAVSNAVETQLKGLCNDVRRIGGQNAADTAREIYGAGSDWSTTAIVATADGYWDALSIAPFAYAKAAPIFLTRSSKDVNERVIPNESLAALRDGGFTDIIIVGGNLAVPEQVEEQVRSIGASPTRLWGENAVETSATIINWEMEQGMVATNMGVATGGGYWDALTGASLCGRLNSVIALTNPRQYEAIDAVLTDHRDDVSHGYVFGGTAAIPAITYDYLCGKPAAKGPLHVDGAKLVDSQGNPVQLRGVSTHGLAWFGQYVNRACFSELHDTWKANVVRLALYTEEYGGYCSGGDKSGLDKLVRNGIRYATDEGMYVIVDWHILSDNNPLTHVDEAKAFFKSIAKEYGEQGNVIYEICNEPNGGTTWKDIKRYAEQVIPVIRAQDPDGIVIVGTPTWSQEVDKALASPLDFDNVMYTLHFYAATHKDDLRNRMVSCARAGLPIFVTEFGICEASGNGQVDEASADQWVATMNSLDISYCMWNLSNKAEASSIVASSYTATSGFTYNHLTKSGRWLYRTLTSDRNYANLPEDSPESEPSGGSDPADTESHVVDQGSLEVSVRLVNSWPNGDGMGYQFEASVSNRGTKDVNSWQVQIPFNKALSYDGNGWNANVSVSGTTVSLSNLAYNGTIAAGESTGGIGFIVMAEQGLAVQ